VHFASPPFSEQSYVSMDTFFLDTAKEKKCTSNNAATTVPPNSCTWRTDEQAVLPGGGISAWHLAKHTLLHHSFIGRSGKKIILISIKQLS